MLTRSVAPRAPAGGVAGIPAGVLAGGQAGALDSETLRFLAAGDSALVAEFGSVITPELNARVVALDRELSAAPPPGIVELVPTYRSLMVVYDAQTTGFSEMRHAVAAAAARCEDHAATRGRRWVVPVHYGPVQPELSPHERAPEEGGGEDGESGDDLAHVARHAAMSEHAVIRLLTRTDFCVYMIGFAPGFTYLGGLPERLHIPRRSQPRARVEAGSIMVGGMQAAIASVPIPTGWYVMGHTPVRAFDMRRTGGVFLFHAGDTIRFEAVDRTQFDSLQARAAQGEPVARLEA